MAKSGGSFRNVLIWTFERGTLQYDIICALILAFIFLVPRSCFNARRVDGARIAPIQNSQGAPAVPADPPPPTK